jgi:hypothetical protein
MLSEDIMTRTKICTLFAGYAALAALAAGQQPGRISGVVVDQNGAPVVGALVLYHSIPDAAANGSGRFSASPPLVSSGLRTGADGSFTIPGLPEGKYSVCGYAATPGQLGTCEWGRYTPVVQAAAGGAVANVALQLAEGTLVTFRVSDPSGVIRDTASGPPVNGRMPLSGGNFRIGVMLGPYYARAEFASQSGVARTYTVAVPQNVSLVLIADTSLQVATAYGGAVPAREMGFSINVGGSSEQVVDLTVE